MRIVSKLTGAVLLVWAVAGPSVGQDYKLSEDSLPQQGVPAGVVTEYTWDNSNIYPDTTRKYWVYVPAQYDKSKPACVMVFQDGATYVNPKGDARVPTVLDNLIAKGEVPVTIAIFIDPGKRKPPIRPGIIAPSIAGNTFTVEGSTWSFAEDGKATISTGGNDVSAQYTQDGQLIHVKIGSAGHEATYDGERFVLLKKDDERSVEYDMLGDQYAQFLIQEILPEIAKQYSLVGNAAGRAICGISSGGICAFTVAWERPQAFSKVISHVGSFTNIRGGHVYPFLIRKTSDNPKPIRVFLQEGERDLDNVYGNWRLGNLQMEAALKFAHYDYRFEMGTEGHNLKHGGAILPDTLRWIWRDYPGVKHPSESGR